jgi:hypothetical protein
VNWNCILPDPILLLAMGSAAMAQRLAIPTSAKLSLTVYIEANIGDSSLAPICMQAEGVASGMFATAGVHINWRTGRPKRYHSERPVLIDITSNTPETFYRGALAFTPVFEGVHIRIFYDRVRNANRPQATTMLLAHVLVHEITHVLEGVNHHSEDGVMKAAWTADDLLKMLSKPLPFDPEDVRLIRESLANRARAARKPPLGLISPPALSNCSRLQPPRAVLRLRGRPTEYTVFDFDGRNRFGRPKSFQLLEATSPARIYIGTRATSHKLMR